MSTAPLADNLPQQNPQAAHPTRRTVLPNKRLSCTSCRRRKVKCSKADPCDQCQEYDLECVYPARRVRVRRRLVGSGSRDTELLHRIKRLEEMLAKKVDLQSAGVRSPVSGSIKVPTMISQRVDDQGTQPDITVDDHYASFIRRQGSSSRHLDSEFWSSLSDEFDGLRHLIENTEEQDDDDDDSKSSTSSSEVVDPSPNLMFQDPDNFINSEISYPPISHSEMLFQFYFNRVDPLCKILHRPTVNIYVANADMLMDHETHRFQFSSLEAVTFAAYFAAVISMSPQECLANLGEERHILVARYKRFTELALVRADFMNSLEASTLQALTIYTVTQRALNQSRFSWTLIGIIVRIAYSLGLHQDGDGRRFSAFEAEMRRRLWWQILALDLRASEDRAAEPLFAEDLHTTIMPCNLNDEDISYNSQHPLASKTGPTDMSLSLLYMDALCTGRKINFGSVALGSKISMLQDKERLVNGYTKRLESTYLANSDKSDLLTKRLQIMGYYWTHKLWLMSYYPLHHQAPSQRVYFKTRGLQTAFTYLSIEELMENDPCLTDLSWLLQTYVPWHAVAVILAEICTQPRGPVADRAWKLVERRFKDWNSKATDSKETMLWGPINTLRKRARAARQKALDQQTAENHGSITNNLGASQMSTEHLEGGNTSRSLSPQTFDASHLINETIVPPLEFTSFNPTHAMAASTESPYDPNNLDYWNDYIFDVTALSEEFVVDPFGMASMHVTESGID